MSMRSFPLVCRALFAPAALAKGADRTPQPSQFEKVPAEEATQIQNITKLTFEHMVNRYPGDRNVLRVCIRRITVACRPRSKC